MIHVRYAALCFVVIAGAVHVGCAPTGPHAYGGYQATLYSPQSGQPLSQPGEIVKKEFVFPRAPAMGSRHPSHPNVLFGNATSDGFGGWYVDIMPARGFRWANPGNLGDKRVVAAR